jgi:hypothetical protein
MRKRILKELVTHAPFTAVGAATGIAIFIPFVLLHVPRDVAQWLFWTLHPLHVLLSALVTTAMYKRYGRGGLPAAILVGYVGAVAIGTLSDSLLPYLGELALGHVEHGHVHPHLHAGFIEKWWLVNPLAGIGIAIGWLWPQTKIPHAGHVLLSTWASLFHVLMDYSGGLGVVTMLLLFVILAISVWLPCCASDIIFPLLFVGKGAKPPPCAHHHH